MSLLELLEDVIVEEVSTNNGVDSDLTTGSAVNYIKEGCHKVTIDKAFLEQTSSKGMSLTIITKGENIYQGTIYPFDYDKKLKKLTTVQSYGGKTSTKSDFKLFKQLIFVATGELFKGLGELDKTEENIEYKSYGKTIKKNVVLVNDLTDKELTIGIRRKAKYRYDSEAEETDKTQYALTDDGEMRYDYQLNSVYTADGLSPEESILKKEPTKCKSDDEWLRSDKGIYKPKLEVSPTEGIDTNKASSHSADIDDDVDF